MTADEQEIREVVAEWARATKAGDLATINALMDDDVLFFTASNEPFGRETFQQHFEKNVKTMEIDVRAEVREVAVSGELAFARTWLEVRILPKGGEPMLRKGYALGVYRQCPGGRWKLWRDANFC
jgi:uncharacterized protein (TIGR02246 family)